MIQEFDLTSVQYLFFTIHLTLDCYVTHSFELKSKQTHSSAMIFQINHFDRPWRWIPSKRMPICQWKGKENKEIWR